MCHYLSGVITKDMERILFGELDSHAGIEAGWDLKPGEYREFEWVSDHEADLTVRVEEGEDENAYRAAILTRYPTRADLVASITEGRWRSNGYHVRSEYDNGCKRVERDSEGDVRYYYRTDHGHDWVILDARANGKIQLWSLAKHDWIQLSPPRQEVPA